MPRKTLKKALVAPKWYVLTFANCEPQLDGPFDSAEARDAEARRIFADPEFSHGEDGIGYLDVDDQGVPTVGTYLDEDLEEPLAE